MPDWSRASWHTDRRVTASQSADRKAGQALVVVWRGVDQVIDLPLPPSPLTHGEDDKQSLRMPAATGVWAGQEVPNLARFKKTGCYHWGVGDCLAYPGLGGGGQQAVVGGGVAGGT